MSDTQEDRNWNRVLLKWLESWIHVYRDHVTKAYQKLNDDLIPNRRYGRAMAWCMHIFDVTILAHQMVSLVYETERGVQSVYYLDSAALTELLVRLENTMNQCRDTFDELATVDAIEHTYAALTDNVNGAERLETALASLSRTNSDANGEGALPAGLSAYKPDSEQAALMDAVLAARDTLVDQQPVEIATSLEILQAASDRRAVQAANLDYRLPPNRVRAIMMIAVPGDALLARQLCESYIAKLAQTVAGVEVYRFSYAELLSKWRGGSEQNFKNIIDWMLERAKENALDQRRFHVLWMDDVHTLMSQRGQSSASEEHWNTIKNTMLQEMDTFNKNEQLSRFALLFSTGVSQSNLDAAFRRRIDNIYELRPLGETPNFREIVLKHALRVTRLNVEGDALKQLRKSETASDIQSAVFAYYVHAKFTVSNEFNLVKPKTAGYTLEPFQSYYNVKGGTVRMNVQGRDLEQAVEPFDPKLPRYFYRAGVTDARNLPDETAERTVFVVYKDPRPPRDDELDDDVATERPNANRRKRKNEPRRLKTSTQPRDKRFVHAVAHEIQRPSLSKTAAVASDSDTEL